VLPETAFCNAPQLDISAWCVVLLAVVSWIPNASRCCAEFPQLSTWVDAWRKRPSFKATEEGTLLHDSKL